MSDPEAKSPEHESLEALLRIPLPEAMVEDATALARTAAAAARQAAARLPLDARDPTGFLEVLESLGPETGDG
jgi:hypothetical protein